MASGEIAGTGIKFLNQTADFRHKILTEINTGNVTTELETPYLCTSMKDCSAKIMGSSSKWESEEHRRQL